MRSNGIADERETTERARLIAAAAGWAQPACACRHQQSVGHHRLDLADALSRLPDRYLSHKCADGRWHTGCAGVGAAWDFVLDRAMDCDCDCHQNVGAS